MGFSVVHVFVKNRELALVQLSILSIVLTFKLNRVFHNHWDILELQSNLSNYISGKVVLLLMVSGNQVLTQERKIWDPCLALSTKIPTKWFFFNVHTAPLKLRVVNIKIIGQNVNTGLNRSPIAKQIWTDKWYCLN